MFNKGNLVETKHYLKRGPMEIGAFTLFRVEEVPEDARDYVMCAPMHNFTKTKAEEDGIDYGLTPIATEDLQFFFKGDGGELLNQIMSKAYFSRISRRGSLTISIEDLTDAIYSNKHFSNETSIRRMYD